MKLKEGFVVREVAGRIVALPTSDELNLNMMITLNETAKFLWDILENGAEESELVVALQKRYEIDETTAKNAVDGFIANLKKYEFLAE